MPSKEQTNKEKKQQQLQEETVNRKRLREPLCFNGINRIHKHKIHTFLKEI